MRSYTRKAITQFSRKRNSEYLPCKIHTFWKQDCKVTTHHLSTLPHNLLHIRLSEQLLEIYYFLIFLQQQRCLHRHLVFPQTFSKWLWCFLNVNSLNWALFVSNNPLIKGSVMCNTDKCTLVQNGYKRQNALEVLKMFAFCLCIFMFPYSLHIQL